MIIIDAGHGGNDPGACANGVQEKDWTLEVSLYQFNRLKELGIPVKITRKDESTLNPNKRTNIVKTSGADICISNHFNAGGGTGSEIIHSVFAKPNLADTIAKEINTFGMPVRKVFSKRGNSGRDYFYMHRETGSVQTIIVEYGFLDNEQDFKRLKIKENRLHIAEAIVKALCTYTNNPYKQLSQEEIQTFFCVQIGEFKEREHAEQLAEKMKKDGYPAFVKTC